ncbi:phage integrase SAM-like domain-containing protein [Bacteroides sp.]|uniref:tyrosine-type recombinase/integrase n=1 Tax=Bacteroides sp. TaxID=29523 RepID=UPI0026205978|nr:phage integrase SAM-like domain-containing protein [Bacteroides sp.]MDD3041301.1 phage integrase SAM-like domain-containing protein [Bacteroides sp.]
MATFKACVRSLKQDGTYPVYILVVHCRKNAYIRTQLVVKAKGVKNGEIKDTFIIRETAGLINDYIDRLNKVYYAEWSAAEIKKFLEDEGGELSFTAYAKEFIFNMQKEGRVKPSGNYRTALNSLSAFLKKKDVLFSDLTKKNVSAWLESISDKSRARSLYPKCIRAMFNDGRNKYNDYDLDIIKIKVRPFDGLKIAREDVPDKTEKYISPMNVRRILNYKPVMRKDKRNNREQLAVDVCKMVFYLCGINLADLYDLKKDNYKDGKLCYNRKKTRGPSGRLAYMEVKVPNDIKHLFERYKGAEDNLFNFSECYYVPDELTRAVNKGLASICKRFELGGITAYYFRHSWATIAQNDCGASTEQVALCLNHASAHKVTSGYIRKSYAPVDKLNAEVVKYVFKAWVIKKSRLISVNRSKEKRKKVG